MEAIFVESLMPDIICRDEILIKKNFYKETDILLLDVGCATGFFMSKFRNSVGIDLSKENLVTAKKLLPNNEFVLSEASNLPFREGVFDRLILMEVIEHTKKPTKTIKDCHRCLNINGVFLISFDICSPSRFFTSYIAQKFVVVEKLAHHKSEFSDIRDWSMVDQQKFFGVAIPLFDVVSIIKFKGLLIDLINIVAISMEKLSRPKTSALGDIGSQHFRVNSPLIKNYMRFFLPIIRKMCRYDPFKWSAGGVMVLAKKKDV